MCHYYTHVPDAAVGLTVDAETQAAARLTSATDVINFRQRDVIASRGIFRLRRRSAKSTRRTRTECGLERTELVDEVGRKRSTTALR